MKFDKTDFTEASDFGHSFSQVFFRNAKFTDAGIGYRGSSFTNSYFKRSNFTKAVFIRADFNRCVFDSCKLKGINFNGPSFVNCDFIGTLEDVWFRRNYRLEIYMEQFVISRINEMKNVSFENATLLNITYSNSCDLSTIKMPKIGNYQAFPDWKRKLEKLKTKLQDWPSRERKEVEIFVNSYLVHAKHQDWYILNINEMRDEFGVDIANNILIELSS